MSYSDEFMAAVEQLFRFEGIDANEHEADTGGLTKFGISKAAYPSLDISNLTRDDALAIYWRDWWQTLKCPELKSKYVAIELFEAAVNVGHRRGVKFLQEACNLLQAGDEEITVDGIIGPVTVGTANELSERYELALVASQNLLQGMWYACLKENNPGMAEHFMRGWMKRCVAPKELL